MLQVTTFQRKAFFFDIFRAWHALASRSAVRQIWAQLAAEIETEAEDRKCLRQMFDVFFGNLESRNIGTKRVKHGNILRQIEICVEFALLPQLTSTRELRNHEEGTRSKTMQDEAKFAIWSLGWVNGVT